MHRPRLLHLLRLSPLGAAFLAAGCQFISGLNDLERTEPGGPPNGGGGADNVGAGASGAGGAGAAGAGGADGGAGATGGGGFTGGGGADGGGGAGGGCEGPADCPAADDCKSFTCEDGDCVPQNENDGGECNAGCTDDVLTTGECDAGECVPGNTSCAPFACEAGACTNSCAGPAECASMALCDVDANACHACGTTAEPVVDCTVPDEDCDVVTGWITTGDCKVDEDQADDVDACLEVVHTLNGAGAKTLDVSQRPGIVTCMGNDCKGPNLTFTCVGDHLCVLRCPSGSCHELIFNCGDGPCRVECLSGDACSDMTVNCGENSCDVVLEGNADPQPEPDVECGSSCGCTPPP